MIEVRINGEALELFNDEDNIIRMNYAIYSLHSVDSRQQDYSNDFGLPLTAKNKRLLQLPQNLNSFGVSPYRKLPVEVEEGGVVLKGTMQIVRITDVIEVSIQAGNADFFTLLENKSVQELNLSKHDHEWTEANVLNSVDNTWEDGYTYPVIDYGRLSEREYERGTAYFEMYPALFAKSILMGLLNRNGWTLSGSYANDKPLEKLLVVNPLPPAYDEEFIKARSSKATFESSSDLTARQTLAENNPVNTFLRFNRDTDDKFTYDGSANNYHAGTSVYRADKPMFLDITVSITYKIEALIGKSKIKYALHKNGVEIAANERYFRSGTTGNRINDYTYQHTFSTIPVNPDDTLNIRLEISKDSDVFNYRHVAHLDRKAYLEIKPLAQVPPGGRISLNSFLPDISQKDFIRYLVNKDNLLVRADSERHILYLDYFNKVTDNIPFAEDWSRKVDYLEAPEQQFFADGYGQRSMFQYAGDESVPDGFGADALLLDNEHLPKEEVVYEAPFAATEVLPTMQGAMRLPYIPLWKPKENTLVRFWEPDIRYYTPNNGRRQDFVYFRNFLYKLIYDGDKHEGSINNQPDISAGHWKVAVEEEAYEKQELSPRILIRAARTQPAILVSQTNESPQEYSNPAEFVPLSFTNLLRNSYRGLGIALKHAKYVRVPLRLTAYDIATLDYLRPKLINSDHYQYGDRLNAYFYLLQVNAYEHGQHTSCWVDLLKIDYEFASDEQQPRPEALALLLTEERGPILKENGRFLLHK